MRYDLEMVHELAGELGFEARLDYGRSVEVDFGSGAVLCFVNAEAEADCLVGFRDTPWHMHDAMIFADGQGYYTELGYLDLLTGLADGQVLICELRRGGDVVDRRLVHAKFNDEFGSMELGEAIAVRRVQARLNPGSC